MNPDSALEILKKGNLRFVNDQSHYPRQSGDYRKKQVSNQSPFCAILACSDSRVPVEIVFDQGIGDIFVVRLAGNVASETAIESLSFATHMLGVSLIVVMGHQNCGAVNAAISHDADEDLGIIGSLIQASLIEKISIKEAIIANVKAQTNLILSHSLLKPQLSKGSLKVCSAYYDFETGLVTFL